jgi:hypothetical protein
MYQRKPYLGNSRVVYLKASAQHACHSLMDAFHVAAMLIRNACGVELAPVDQPVLRYARQVKQTLVQLDQELGDYELGINGHIRIHAISSALS